VDLKQLWQDIPEDVKLLLKKLAIAALALYVVLQLVGLFFPIVFTAFVIYFVYNKYIEPNPNILK
tara:strand:- start:1991 stop:2185 length:195 start_codon:yes stop_codon:yes gene_type:complete